LVTYFAFRFVGAGTYRYEDTGNTKFAFIKVPMKESPTTGHVTTRFTVTWAAGAPPPGYAFDIQIKRPGSLSFVAWKSGVTSTNAHFTPNAGKGTYSFRARLRKLSNSAASGYSPVASIKVS
jgi:hypothetical protein